MSTPNYDAMLAAIDAMKGVDLAAGIEDPAEALAVILPVARNLEPERQAASVRLRAEREYCALIREQAGFPPKGTRRRR